MIRFQRLFGRALVPLIVLFGGTAVRAAETKSAKPNIIFILADDLGYMDIGANNPKTFYETPNIDRLARAECVSRKDTPRAASVRPRAAAS